MYKSLFLILYLLNFLSVFSQDTAIFEYFNRNSCEFTEQPRYIANKNFVVYQDCHTRKILYPDMATLYMPRFASGVFAFDKNGMYVKGVFLPEDTAGFRILRPEGRYPYTGVIWKNKHRVYKDDQEWKGVDVASFEPFLPNYYRDKNSIYYEGKKIEGSDGSSAKELTSIYGHHRCYDKNYVYENGEISIHKGDTCRPVNYFLIKTRNRVFYPDQPEQDYGMDACSIKALSEHFAMDKQHVYYDTLRLPILRANLSHVKVWEQYNNACVSDGYHIYASDGKKQKNLDALSFGMIPHSYFFYDKKGIYVRQWHDSLDILINKRLPFLYSNPVSAQNTWETSDGRFVIYKRQAYDISERKFYKNLTDMQMADAKAGRLFLKANKQPGWRSPFYIKDNKVFSKYYGGVISEDSSSFTHVFGPFYKDKYRFYYIIVNIESLRYEMKIMNNVDMATFEQFNIFARDKDSLYFGLQTIMSSEEVEVLAEFQNYRPPCGNDRNMAPDYYLMRNKDGFWLITLSSPLKVQYLGTVFKPSWHKVFEHFEMP